MPEPRIDSSGGGSGGSGGSGDADIVAERREAAAEADAETIAMETDDDDEKGRRRGRRRRGPLPSRRDAGTGGDGTTEPVEDVTLETDTDGPATETQASTRTGLNDDPPQAEDVVRDLEARTVGDEATQEPTDFGDSAPIVGDEGVERFLNRQAERVDEVALDTGTAVEERIAGVEALPGDSEDKLGRLAGGATTGVVGVANLPGAGVAAQETAETGAFVGSGFLQGPGEGFDRLSRVGRETTRFSRGIAQGFAESPARTAGAVAGGAAGGILTGTALSTTTRRATRGARNVRTRLQADETVTFEDISSERGVEGELPEFDTDPGAPTAEAVEEVRDRAANQPDAVQEATGTERVLFRSESERLPEDLEAGRGNFELPGLFTSPDASPIRTRLSGDGRSILPRPGIPRLRDFSGGRTQRLSAFEGDRIEGAPQRAADSGFAVRDADGDIVERFPNTGAGAADARKLAEDIGGERVPDPDTGGARFLEGDADEGTAFVRATGDRSTELEAIFPPGSQFRRSGQLAVELPNDEVGTLDVFRRADDEVGDAQRTDTDTGDADRVRQDTSDADGETVSLDDIRRQSRRGSDREPRTPVTPFSAPPSSGSGGTRSSQRVRQTRSGTPTRTTTTDPTGVSEGPPTTGPATEPTTGDSGVPTEPPTTSGGPPTSSPTDPPTTTDAPPSGPPSDPPTTTGGPPTGPPSDPPTRRPDIDLDPEADSDRDTDGLGLFDRRFRFRIGSPGDVFSGVVNGDGS